MRFLVVLAILLTSTISYADVYVVYKTDGKEIVSLSNENDCVIMDDMKLEILKGIELESIHLNYPPNMYKWQGKEIKPNMAKISAWEADELARYEKQQERKKIDKKLLKDKIREMKAAGNTFKFKHVDEED